ncbi:LysM peptidoglycan-binding domain-containing protein [Facklamia lactis]|uniref:LysM peptidoglycan-binding domain-containing protein n=1 Tax=Facklamia lactis TaxID=2749967 RepID=UPI0018CF03D7|nr:LysM peptidoglycan-binding domain-containing protein [Facklamia lactis]MBG9979861.1 LysM peptidoglycan-binding domain-containing protein [Facklamia lactis]
MKKLSMKQVIIPLVATASMMLNHKLVEAQTLYHVKEGDTLYNISQRYGVSIEELKNSNFLTSSTVFLNQELIIPSNNQSLTEIEVEGNIPETSENVLDETEKLESDASSQRNINEAYNQVASLKNYHSHVVKAGESLGIISRKYHTTIMELMRLNGLANDLIHPGQIIRIPETVDPESAEAPLPSPTEDDSRHDDYTVKAGESLGIIARKFNTTVSELKRLNNLSSDLIHPNQTLKIPSPSDNKETPRQEETTNPKPQDNYYIVRAGESLGIIARKFNTTVSELKRLNNLSSDLIHPNQTLKIPSPSDNQETPGQEETTNPKPQDNYYIVRAGESLGIIARKFNTTVSELKRLNNLSSDLIHPNQTLKIPSPSDNQETPGQEETTNPKPQDNYYIVRAGESLGIIARKFNTTVSELKRLNNLSSDLIHPNQTLKIPSPSDNQETPGQEETTNPKPQDNYYIVRAGESLGIIARKFNTTVSELKRLNNLSSDLIHPNQKLLVKKFHTNANEDNKEKEKNPEMDIQKNYYLSLDEAIKQAKKYFNPSIHENWFVDWTRDGYRVRYQMLKA